jgi:hypothetical protein
VWGVLVAAALLLGVGTFLSWSAAGSEITTAAAGSHMAQGVDGYPLNGSQLVVLGGMWRRTIKAR